MFGGNTILKLTGVSLAAMLLFTGCTGALDAVQADAEVSLGTAVEVEKLKRTTIKNELTYIGQVEPQMQISIASKLAAEVMSVNFDIGDYVNAGDVLFTVDAKDIQDQIRQLEATIQQTQVSVDLAQYGLETAQEGSLQERLTELQYEQAIYSARYGNRSAHVGKDAAKDGKELAELAADVAYATWQAEQAVLDVMISIGVGGTLDGEEITEEMITAQEKRVNAARAEYYAADMQVDQADYSYDNARITADGTNKSLDLAYDSYDAYKEFANETRTRSVRQAEFSLQTAIAAQNTTQVQLAIAQSGLGHAVVTSPISGVVSARSIEAGQMISQASLPFTIIKMDTVNVQVSVSETLINSIHVGDVVEVVIQSVQEAPFAGVVTAVSPAAGTNSTYPVRIELDNSSGLIKPGMFSQVTFVQSQSDNTFVVDKNVVMSDETTQYVYVVEDGIARKVTVTTGLSNGTTTEILSGVSLGDEIVVVGQEYLHDGVNVNVVKRDGQAIETRPAAPVTQDTDEEAETDEEGEPAGEEADAESTDDESDVETADE